MNGMRMARAASARRIAAARARPHRRSSSSCRSATACRCATSTPAPIDGRLISVQATGVRVEAAGGPATLTIMFDITARLAAEAALRRSEAMLSQLFATSPDCIALYRAPTRAASRWSTPPSARLTGYAAEEVVGRTADELGLWHDPNDRCRLRAALDGEGRIDAMPARIATRSGRLASVLISAAALRHGPARLPGRQRPRRHRRASRRGSSTRRSSSSASIGIALTRDRRFVQANPRFEEMFGWPAGELRRPAGRGGLDRRRRLRRDRPARRAAARRRRSRSRSSAR